MDMRTLTLYRRDFTDAQDGSGDSMFEDVLRQLGIEDPDGDVEQVEISVDSILDVCRA